MWPLGHAAIGYLCYRLSTHARQQGPPTELAVIVLLVGTQFPDLVDKPLAWYAGVLPTGRTLAHSLVVLLPVCVVLYATTARYDRAELGVAFAVGSISHVLVDAAPVLWDAEAAATFLLWPVWEVQAYEEGAPTVLGLLRSSAGDPYFLSEFVFAAIALVLWYRDDRPGLGRVRMAVCWGRRAFGRSP